MNAPYLRAFAQPLTKGIPVPLNGDAVAVLRDQWGKHKCWCFPYKGNAIEEPAGNAWRKALRRAGIDDFRWHDLRHTWASRLVAAGTPLVAVMQMGGWTELSMVQRYAHLNSDHLQEFAERITGAVYATNSPQSDFQEEAKNA